MDREIRDLPQDDIIYRVSINSETNVVEVACLGINRLDTLLEDTYVSVDDLPEWVQRKLALLMMLEVPPLPLTADFPHVPGVGRRVGENVYWVEYTEE